MHPRALYSHGVEVEDEMTLLMREAIGETLRRARTTQSRTLREVSSSARVSLGYLSEVERGRKEASSELLAAICDALAVPIAEVLSDVSATMARASGAGASQPAAAGVAQPDRHATAKPVVDGPRVVIPQGAVRAFAA